MALQRRIGYMSVDTTAILVQVDTCNQLKPHSCVRPFLTMVCAWDTTDYDCDATIAATTVCAWDTTDYDYTCGDCETTIADTTICAWDTETTIAATTICAWDTTDYDCEWDDCALFEYDDCESDDWVWDNDCECDDCEWDDVATSAYDNCEYLGYKFEDCECDECEFDDCEDFGRHDVEHFDPPLTTTRPKRSFHDIDGGKDAESSKRTRYREDDIETIASIDDVCEYDDCEYDDCEYDDCEDHDDCVRDESGLAGLFEKHRAWRDRMHDEYLCASPSDRKMFPKFKNLKSSSMAKIHHLKHVYGKPRREAYV